TTDQRGAGFSRKLDGNGDSTATVDIGAFEAPTVVPPPPPPTHTLTYTAGANGSISGTSPQTVNYGADGSPVTAVPDTGYHFVNWSDSSTQNPRTDTNVTGDISVTANFAVGVTCPASFTVNSNGDDGDNNPGDGICATAGNVCTLRAAIQEANVLGSCAPLIIRFGISGAGA